MTGQISTDEALNRDVTASRADRDDEHPAPERQAQVDAEIAAARDGLFTGTERAEMNPWHTHGRAGGRSRAREAGA
jgi:hypothetical protein